MRHLLNNDFHVYFRKKYFYMHIDINVFQREITEFFELDAVKYISLCDFLLTITFIISKPVDSEHTGYLVDLLSHTQLYMSCEISRSVFNVSSSCLYIDVSVRYWKIWKCFLLIFQFWLFSEVGQLMSSLRYSLRLSVE